MGLVVNLFPVDISECSFEVEGNVDFNCHEREKMRDTVLKQLRKVVDFSNDNLIKNTDSLMAVKPTNKKVELVGGESVPEEHFALSY